MVALFFRIGAHDHGSVYHKKRCSGFSGGLLQSADPPDDLWKHEGIQCGFSFRRSKGAICQQAAVQAAVGIQDICPEPLGQHRQQRRTGQQDLAGDLVGIHQRDTMGGKHRRHSRFAAAAAAGDPKRDHSWITRNAAARIRRLYTAMDRPSFFGQRAKTTPSPCSSSARRLRKICFA